MRLEVGWLRVSLWLLVIFGLYLTLATAAPTTLQPGQNLVPNPSFEEGTTSPVGWTPCPDNSSWDDSVAHTGSRSARNPRCLWESSGISLPQGRYYFGFWHREEPNSPVQYVGYENGAANGPLFLGADIAYNDGQWHYYEAPFTTGVPFDSFIIRLKGSTDNIGGAFGPLGTVWFDDIWLATTPQPSPTTPTSTEGPETVTPTLTATSEPPIITPSPTTTPTPTQSPSETFLCGVVKPVTECAGGSFGFALVSCVDPERPFLVSTQAIPGGPNQFVRLNNPVTRERQPFCTQEFGDINREIVGFDTSAQITSCADCGIPLGQNDSDGDALRDEWESLGFDFNRDGVVDVDLPNMGASRNHRDIFVYIDWLVGSGALHNHEPENEAIEKVKQAFANAPVGNRDGVPGITLHVIKGKAITETQEDLGKRSTLLDGTECGYDWTDFNKIKNELSDFNEAFRPIFHYAIFGHHLPTYPANCGARAGRAHGHARLSEGDRGGHDFIVALGEFDTLAFYHIFRSRMIDIRATAFMHELGHNLGLDHGGAPGEPNFKPNYLSVMNYSFSTGIFKRCQGIYFCSGHVDYSRFGLDVLPPLVESNLDETKGLRASDAVKDYGTRYYCYGFPWPIEPANRRYVDWDCNGVAFGVVAASVNNDSPLSELLTINEWPSLVYDGGDIGNFTVLSGNDILGTMAPAQDITRMDEAGTIELIKELERRSVLLINLASDQDSVSKGGIIGYTISLASDSGVSESNITINISLPPGFAYQPGSTTGVTTTDPIISGNSLLYSGPFTVGPSDVLTLSFKATVSSPPGTFFASAEANSPNFLAQTGNTAPVTVAEGAAPVQCTSRVSVHYSLPQPQDPRGWVASIRTLDGKILTESPVNAGTGIWETDVPKDQALQVYFWGFAEGEFPGPTFNSGNCIEVSVEYSHIGAPVAEQTLTPTIPKRLPVTGESQLPPVWPLLSIVITGFALVLLWKFVQRWRTPHQ